MSKTIQRFSQQISRNKLLQQFKCGKKTLRNAEDIAIELVPDFRAEVGCYRVIGVLQSDGSISVRHIRDNPLSPYQAWVLRQIVRWTQNGFDAYDRTFKNREKLSFSQYHE